MLSVHNLSFRYDAYSKYILEDISFEVKKGEYVSIVGENGSGKSTLVRLLLGLLKPTTGEVQQRAGSIGYVPQKKINLTHFPLTVFELLDSYRKVGLAGFEKKLAGELSGGQLQKLYIARALINKPELLILDEPSTGIDVKGQREIYTILKRLNEQSKITIVSVDHNLDAAVANSTVIFHIANGKGHFCNPKKYAVEAVPSNS